MDKEKRFLNAADVAEVMECSKSKAYTIIKQMNEELKANGYVVMNGKVSSKYFYERTYEGAKQ